MAWVKELHAKVILNLTEASRLLNVYEKTATRGLLIAKLGQKSGRCPQMVRSQVCSQVQMRRIVATES